MVSESRFVHLHLHSEYSLLDGAIRINRLLDHCDDQKIPSIALTDNGNLFGAVDFYFGAKKRDINPIIGTEIFLTDDMSLKNKTKERLILLCQNTQGYENLCQIISAAHIDGFYYNARVDLALLSKYSEGIIAISPGYWGPAAQLLQMHFVDKATEFCQQMVDIFSDRFYLGLQRTGELGSDQVCQDSIDLSKQINVPVVALNDVYFMKDDEGWMQDLLQCIKTGRQIETDDQNNSKRSQHFLRTEQQMIDLFSDIPEAIDNTVYIASQCNLELKSDQVLLPNFGARSNGS